MAPPPEYEFVRLAARATLAPERAERFVAMATDSLDWPLAVRLARYHRVLPLLWIHLNEHAREQTPEDVLDFLRRSSMSTAVRVLFLSSEMARIAERFEVERIPFLVLKGPSLAEAYGSIAHRPFVDNDLLGRRDDFDRIERTLLDLGFNRYKRSQRQLDGYLYVHGEYTFGRAVGTQISTVDMHTSVTPLGFSYAGTYDDLAGRSRPLDVGGRTVQALDWPDLFIVLCVNALKDQWNRLRLACDLSEVAEMVDDWDALEARAASAHSLRACRAGILVSHDEVGGPYPADVVARARADEPVHELATEIREHLQTSYEERILGGRDRARLVLRAQDDLRGQARYLGYVALRRLTERAFSPLDASQRESQKA